MLRKLNMKRKLTYFCLVLVPKVLFVKGARVFYDTKLQIFFLNTVFSAKKQNILQTFVPIAAFFYQPFETVASLNSFEQRKAILRNHKLSFWLVCKFSFLYSKQDDNNWGIEYRSGHLKTRSVSLLYCQNPKLNQKPIVQPLLNVPLTF